MAVDDRPTILKFPKDSQATRRHVQRPVLPAWMASCEHGVARRLSRLHEGDALQVAVEVNNPVTGAAVQLQTVDDYHMIGWAPRYLIKDMLSALGESRGISMRGYAS